MVIVALRTSVIPVLIAAWIGGQSPSVQWFGA
jgi:hypothetical protein